MKRSDFILTIKKETDRMVESWNNHNYRNSKLETSKLYLHITNVELLICIFKCIFRDEQATTNFSVDIAKDHPLHELADLTAFLCECEQVLYGRKYLNSSAMRELSESILAVQSEIENLPIPAELR